MKYRLLGKTKLKVSEIGFGTWGIGGTHQKAVAYGKTSDAESLRALRRAYDFGVTFYDTADLYGYGHSERLLGKAFSHDRDQVVFASKVGFTSFKGIQNFSPAHLRRSLKLSLRRLKTEYLDIYQLHSPPIELFAKDASLLKTMEAMKREGCVRAVGVSVQSPADGLRLLQNFKVDCIQVNFSLVDQRALENGLFDLCRKLKVGVIVRTPLCFGFLAQTPGAARFGIGDHRRRYSPSQIARWKKGYGLFEKALAGDGATPVQNALRFCLSPPAVSTVIPGMLTCEQVEENALASDFQRISQKKLNAIYKIYEETSFNESD